MTRSAWLRVVLIACGAFGGVAALLTMKLAGWPAPRLAFVLVAVWAAVAASIAAAFTLLGSWVERLGARRKSLRMRPLAIVSDRVVYLVPIVAGCGLLLASIIVISMAFDRDLVVVGVLAIALAVAAMWASRTPSAATSIGLLLATMLSVEIPRELGWLDVTLLKSSSSWTGSSHRDGECRARGPMSFDSHLTGNVGALIETDDPDTGSIRVEVTGHADVGWFTCMLPLVKPVSYSTSVHFEVTGACSVSGDLEGRDRLTTWGIASCHHVRREMANRLRDAIADAIRKR